MSIPDANSQVTAPCPNCGRVNSVHTCVCPRCETRFSEDVVARAIQETSGEWYIRGIVSAHKPGVDKSIADDTEAIRLNPEDAEAYCSRAMSYYLSGQDDKAWADVEACQRFEGKVPPEFLAELRKASGREKHGWVEEPQAIEAHNQGVKALRVNDYDLGTPIRTFGATSFDLVGGIVLGMLLIGGGAMLLFSALFCIGIPLVLGGVFLLIWVRSLFSLRICLFTKGLSYRSLGKAEEFPWDDIASAEGTITQHEFGISHKYAVRRNDGKEFSFSSNSTKHADDLGCIIRAELERRQIPCEVNVFGL